MGRRTCYGDLGLLMLMLDVGLLMFKVGSLDGAEVTLTQQGAKTDRPMIFYELTTRSYVTDDVL